MKKLLLAIAVFCLPGFALAQAGLTAHEIYTSLQQKVNKVQDYTADVRMKVDVAFMKMPVLRGKLYFKNPDKLRLDRKGGISVLPKKSMNLTLNNVFASGQVTVIDAGTELIGNTRTRVLKVVPEAETDMVLTKIWVDEARMLVLRTQTTTRDNGTVKMDLEYGKYLAQALPDRITFFMDVKDFKLPKGVTMDYDDGRVVEEKARKMKARKGTVRIEYLSYQLNTGLTDATFNQPQK